MPKGMRMKRREKFLLFCLCCTVFGSYKKYFNWHDGLNWEFTFDSFDPPNTTTSTPAPATIAKTTNITHGEQQPLLEPQSNATAQKIKEKWNLLKNATTRTASTKTAKFTPIRKARKPVPVTHQSQREDLIRKNLADKPGMGYLKHTPLPDEHPFIPEPPSSITTTDPYQHAIIIPYRNRSYHLQEFIDFMHPYLQHQFPNHTFTLWVVEQANDDLFNRGWLTNVGLAELKRTLPQTNCVILHDVDLVPNGTDAYVPYTSCEFPMHLSKQMENWGWKIPYNRYCGGITSLSLKDWQVINGMSNDYVGWGGEDDDLWHRLRMNGLLLHPDPKAHPIPKRPPDGQGVFQAISEREEHHVQVKTHDNGPEIQKLLEEMWRDSHRWQTEGWNDVYYSVLNTTKTLPTTTETNDKAGGFAGVYQVQAIPRRSKEVQLDVQEVQVPKSDEVTAVQSTFQPVLELLDIPYSGGDHVTRVAARSNIVWGACHYGNYTKYDCQYANNSGDWKYQGVVKQRSYKQSLTPWYLRMQEWKTTPLTGTDRFVVVRNPYHRAIDFYRTCWDRWNIAANATRDEYLKEREQADSLNTFLQKYLDPKGRSWKAPPFMRGVVDLLPQKDVTGYCNSSDHTIIGEYEHVQYVLKYEQLQEDFQALLDLHPHYSVQDLSQLATELGEAEKSSGTLSATDLTPKTIDLLNDVYREDFQHWNYEMLDGSQKNRTGWRMHPRGKNHHVVYPKSSLEFIPIPFNGLEGDITRAASRAGVVWGACHYDIFEEYECPPDTSGDLHDALKFTLSTEQALEPWRYPIKTWARNPYEKHKMFGVVRNPYFRTITFYRHMYDLEHGYPKGYRADAGQNATDYLNAREDRNVMNKWLQTYFVKHHHPHRPDGMILIPQNKYTAKLNYIPKIETLGESLQRMFSRHREGLPKELKAGLLAVVDQTQSPASLDAVELLGITDLSDVTVAMINEIYNIDFFKYYPGMKMKTNATTAAFWKPIIPIPPIGKGGNNNKPKPPPKPAVKAAKAAPRGTRKAADFAKTSARASFGASFDSIVPSENDVTSAFQRQSASLKKSEMRLQEYRTPRMKKPS